jgi:hypothetical protein
MAEAIDKFVAEGLSSIFVGGYRSRGINGFGLQILNDPAFEGYFSNLINSDDWTSEAALHRIAKTFLQAKEDESGAEPSPFWKDNFSRFSSPDYVSKHVASYVRGNCPHIEYGMEINDNLDTYTLFELVHNDLIKNNWVNTRWLYLLNRLGEENPLSLKLVVDTKLFGKSKAGRPKSAVRGRMYRKYIECGFLDLKTARKIRSESSEEASVAGVKALLECGDIYENHTDLLLSFSDSRYPDVLYALANGLPVYLLSSLLGTENDWVRRTVEARMNSGE